MDVTAIAYQPVSVTGAYSAPFATAGSAAGPFMAADPQRTHDKAQAYGDYLVLRLTQQAEGEDKDASALASALVSAIDTIGAEHGDAAATAAIGMLAKNIGDGEITEENLGNGLLDVLRFTDRNFGFAAGDKLIDSFNGDLNDAINAYFDNGLTEKFYAVESGASTLVQAAPQLVNAVQDALGEEAADLVADILEQGLEDGVSFTNFRKSLARAKHALNKDIAPGAASVLAHAAKDTLHGMAPAPPPQPGALLDVAV